MYSDLAFAKCVSGAIDLHVSRALTVCLATILSAAYALEMAVLPFLQRFGAVTLAVSQSK